MRSNGASNLVVSRCVCAWFWGLCAVAKASVWDVLLLSLGLQKATLGRFPPTQHLLLRFCLVACRLPRLSLRKVSPCWRQSLFFVFHGFRKRRFGSFLVCGFAWFGHETCWGSRPPKVLEAHSATLFVVAVSHGLGTNPAAVRRFRKRSAKGLGR